MGKNQGKGILNAVEWDIELEGMLNGVVRKACSGKVLSE